MAFKNARLASPWGIVVALPDLPLSFICAISHSASFDRVLPALARLAGLLSGRTTRPGCALAVVTNGSADVLAALDREFALLMIVHRAETTIPLFSVVVGHIVSVVVPSAWLIRLPRRNVPSAGTGIFLLRVSNEIDAT